MKQLRPAARRLLSIAAATVAGLAAALVIASPASAHHIDIGVSKTCQQDGTWKVTWTVNNSEDDLAGKVTAVALTPAGTTVSNIVVDAVLPADGSLVGTQIVPGDAAGATISVTVHWNRDGPTPGWPPGPTRPVRPSRPSATSWSRGTPSFARPCARPMVTCRPRTAN